MKPIFQIAAAFAFLALGACSTAIDAAPAAGPSVAAAPMPAGVPQFAAGSAALAGLLAEGNAARVTYVPRGSAPVVGGHAGGTCPYAQALRAGVLTAAAAPLRPLEEGRVYRFTNY
jgi:hypothetical protein